MQNQRRQRLVSICAGSSKAEVPRARRLQGARKGAGLPPRVSATARAALEVRAAAAAAGAVGLANGGEKNPRTQAPLGSLEKALPESTAEKAGDAHATLLFAELPVGQRSSTEVARFNYTINASLYDLLTEALNPGFAFAIA